MQVTSDCGAGLCDVLALRSTRVEMRAQLSAANGVPYPHLVALVETNSDMRSEVWRVSQTASFTRFGISQEAQFDSYFTATGTIASPGLASR